MLSVYRSRRLLRLGRIDGVRSAICFHIEEVAGASIAGEYRLQIPVPHDFCVWV